MFLGVSYVEADREVKEWFESTLRACGFEVVTAEASEHETLGEKIRRKIESCDVSSFVLSQRDKLQDKDEWKPPAWIQGEIGIAYGFHQKMAIFIEEKVVAEGLIPNIEDYTRFARARLDEDTPKILASMLALRLPELQEAIETLMNRNRIAPLIVLRGLRKLVSEVADFRRMKNATPRCRVVSLVQQNVPTLILGAGSVAGILNGTDWTIVEARAQEIEPAEIPLGVVRIFYVQPNFSQAKFVDASEGMKLKDSLDDYEIDGSIRELKNTYALPRDPDPSLFPTSTVEDIDNFVKVIDQLLTRVQT